MSVFLLIIIYLAFISLGLPDSMLGSGWPVISSELNVSLSTAGLIAMTISIGTVISSLLSNLLIQKFGTKSVVIISVLLTAVSLIGFSFIHHPIFFFILALPLGLGAGAIDAALNHYVSMHYAAKHMNWLHSFWGVGATLSPLIMSFSISQTHSWRNGYLIVGSIQTVLVLILISTQFLWKNKHTLEQAPKHETPDQLSKIKGIVPAMLSFFLYCSLEASTGLWGSSFLVHIKSLDVTVAATVVSTFYLGITLGRLISGFLSIKFSNKSLIRLGLILIACGVLFLLFNQTDALYVIGFSLIGLGCAPIYPAMLHETPKRFGAKNGVKLMGIQMASAYIGTTFMPMLVGLISSATTLWIYPIVIGIFGIFLAISNEIVNKRAYHIQSYAPLI